MNRILVAGCSNSKGSKISKFLTNKGYMVFGVDKFVTDNIASFIRFFRIDLRQADGMRLVFLVAKPDTIIYCADYMQNKDSFQVIEYNYTSYLNFLICGMEKNVKKVILCVENIVSKPETPYDVTQLALRQLTEVFEEKYKTSSLIIDNEVNLLKSIKKFLSEGGGEEVL